MLKHLIIYINSLNNNNCFKKITVIFIDDDDEDRELIPEKIQKLAKQRKKPNRMQKKKASVKKPSLFEANSMAGQQTSTQLPAMSLNGRNQAFNFPLENQWKQQVCFDFVEGKFKSPEEIFGMLTLSITINYCLNF